MRAATGHPLAGLGAWLALLGLGLLVYAPAAWTAGFVNFDDNLFFGPDNPEFLAVHARGDWGAILDPGRAIANAYLPVSHLSLYVDYALGQIVGHPARLAHLHSLLLHVCAAFVLARLFGRLGLARLPATLAAALFLLHPALVESVSWAASRKDVLSGLFAFLCLSSVAEYARAPRRMALVGAFAFALLALYAKGTAVVLLLLAPVVAWLAAADGAGRRRAFGAATGLVAAVALAVGLHHARVAAGQGTLQAVDLAQRVQQVPGAVWHYLHTMVWPTRLNVLYPEVETLAGFRDDLWFGVLALAVWLAAVVVASRRGQRLLAAALAMALLALAPFNTAWPASAIAAADRYLYLVIPWAALAAVAWHRRWAPWCAAAAVLACAWLAHERSQDFRDSGALWQSSLAAHERNAVARLNLAMHVLPDDAARARTLAARAVADARYPQHLLRAQAFLRDLAWQNGRLEEACRHARAAAEAAASLPPGEAARGLELQSWLTAATLQRAAGLEDAARASFEAARGLFPEHPVVLAYEAELLRLEHAVADGSVDPGSAASRRSRALLDRAFAQAGDAPPYDLLLARARWQQARGELMSALAHFRRARTAAPERAEAHLGLCDLYLGTGDYAAADDAARQGIAGGVSDPNLLLRLGLAMTGQGRLDDAAEYYEAYLAMRPGDAPIRRALAAVLAAQTMRQLYQRTPAELDASAARIQELDPTNHKALLIRGLAMRLQRDFAAAQLLLEQARAAMPDNEDAHRLLAETLRDHGYQRLYAGETEAALDRFRAFVDQQAPGVKTDAALDILRTHWRRHEKAGVAGFQASDFAAAEAAFRRCLQLVPEQTSACLQLGLAVLQQEDGRAAEALTLFERAERGQLDAKLDASLPVLYQLHALRRLGREEEAVARGRRYLDGVTLARPSVLERIRALVGG